MTVEQLIEKEFPEPLHHRTKNRCTRCEEWKPFDQFYPQWKDVDPSIRCSSMCKPCYNVTYGTEYKKSLRMKKAGLLV